MRKKKLAAYVVGSVVLVLAVTIPALAARANPTKSSVVTDPLAATIIGPDTVRPNSMCLYQANVHGGVPPYSYTWYGPGSGGSDPDFIENNTGSGFSYWITLVVFDAVSTRVQANLRVHTDPNAPICPY
ncbi:MAG TPA: hypothetical protein VFK04_12745 [Gemmatimonadaceae bacterium]|jgi:hypothetical protein|nr:hypothetical protein [Gemmatimonadaceae bacterium]